MATATKHNLIEIETFAGPGGPLSMPQSLDRKVGEWRDAESKARAAEKSLTLLLFDQGEKPQPTDDLITQAKLLRELANEKLKDAIAAMRPQR